MAYTNFQNCTKAQYENIIYSQGAKNRIKILFNNVELQDAGRYCEKLSIVQRILPVDGSKRFSLDNFVSKELTLILHDIDTNLIQDQVSISIGTLVSENTWEYVPIGIFNIQGTPTTDKNKITISLRDNRVKFDFGYNAKPLIDANGGRATKKQILNDICTKANVTCDTTTFLGENDEIGIYDSSISATIYVSYIAEQAGRIPTITRDGHLVFIDITNLTIQKIPLNLVEKYEIGKKYTIQRAVYEGGLNKYQTSDDETLDTLYLNSANPYISSQSQVTSIFQNVSGFETDSIKTGKILGNPSIDPYDLIQIYGYYETLPNGNKRFVADENTIVATFLANNNFTYNGIMKSEYETIIGEEERKENITIHGEAVNRKEARAEFDNINGTLTLLADEIQENEEKIDEIVTTTETTDVSKSFHIEKAINEKPIEMVIYGDTSQNGTPTPTTPINVEVVMGRQTIDLCGSNIFDKSKIVTTTARQTILSQLDTGVRATYTGTGGGTYRWQYYRIPNSKCYFGKTYTLYSNISASANNNGQVAFWQINANGDAVGNRIGSALTSSGSITVTFPNSFSTGASDFAILFYSNMNGTVVQNDYVDYTNVKLEYGTQATEYEAFNGNTYEINLGKNLYDPSFRKANNKIHTGNCTATEENGIFTLTATNNDMYIWQVINSGNSYGETAGQLYELESDYYVVSIGNNLFTKNYVTFYDENKVSLGYVSKSSNVFTFSKTTKTGAKYFSLRFGYSPATIGESYSFTIQLEKGTQATSYAKYKTPIELCKIDNYKDRIYKQDNKWYIEKQIAKLTLTGEENWQKVNLAFQVGASVSPNKGDVSLNAYSNYYIHHYYSSGITTNIQNGEFGWNSSKALTIRNDSCSTASDFKTWLSNNKTNIYYVVETPIIEEISDIELLEQLNAFELLTGINNIYINSNDLIANVYFKYYLETPLSDTYVNHVELNAQLQISSKEITSSVEESVSKTYATIGDVDATLVEIGNTNEKVNSLEGNYTTIEKTATEAKQTASDLTIELTNYQEQIGRDGVSKVKTTQKKFTFDDNGLNISSSDSDTNTTINTRGLYVDNNIGQNMLTADNEGVIATNLTAKNYLITKPIRGEKVTINNEVRYGYFWIGE